MKTTLLALAAVLAEGKTPLEWIEIAFTGQWDGHPDGPFSITEADLRSCAELFARASREVVIDYNHLGMRPHNAEQGRAAGWITAMEVRPSERRFGLWAKVRWTAPAHTAIVAEEYRYVSPTLMWGYSDKVSGKVYPCYLHSLALTNTPFLDGLPAIAAREEVTMPGPVQWALLLGLSEAQAEAPEPILRRLRSEAEASRQLMELTKTTTPEAALDVHRSLMKREAELMEHAKTAKVTALCEQAEREKKVVPSQAVWFKAFAERDVEGAQAWLTGAPVVVPSQAATTQKVDGASVTLTDEHKLAAKRLGLTEEAYRTQLLADKGVTDGRNG